MLRKVGDWLLDDQADTLSCGDTRRKIERRAMAALVYLTNRPGEVVSKDDLVDAVWGGAAISDHSVAIVISQLRKAFGDEHAAPRYIETIPKRGYRLVAAVSDPAPGVARAILPKAENRRAFLFAVSLVPTAVIAGGVYFTSAQTGYSLAIADFQSSGGEVETDAAFALTELVCDNLARRSRSHVFRWRGATSDDGLSQVLQAGGSRQRVALLTGLVFNERGATRVSVQVRDASSGEVLHSGVYEVTDARLSLSASAIARDVAAASGSDWSETRATRGAPDLYAKYWRARLLAARSDPTAIRAARETYLYVLGEDPAFGPAHAELAALYATATPELLGEPGLDTVAAARAHLAQAHRLGEDSSCTAVTSARLDFFHDKNFPAAIREVRRATELDPNDAAAWCLRALIASVGGRASEAVTAIRRAESIDPAEYAIRWMHVLYLYLAGRHSEALDQARGNTRFVMPNPFYETLIYDALERPDAEFNAWLTRARMRGVDDIEIGRIRQRAERNGLEAGYARLVELRGVTRDDGDVPCAILCLKANHRGAAVDALLAADPRVQTMVLHVDRLTPLRALRTEPRLQPLFAQLADFRS